MENFKIVFLVTVFVVLTFGLMFLTLVQTKLTVTEVPTGRSAFDTVLSNFFPISHSGNVLCSDCGDNIPLSALNTSTENVYTYFDGSYTFDKPLLRSWVADDKRWKLCDDRVEVYSDLFGILHDVVMFPTKRQDPNNVAKGGEEIRNVIKVLHSGYKQKYTFNLGLFEMNCNSNAYKGSRQLNWLKFLNMNSVKNEALEKMPFYSNDKYVVAVSRGDYANMHNWMRNIFNTFLMMMFFKVQPRNVQVIFMDGHPLTELDKAWAVLYGPILRVGQIQEPQRFKHLILNFAEHEGPASEFRNKEVPYIEEFRSFLLTQFQLPDVAKLNCSKLQITLIFRRNAVYHPGNLEGKVGRKIFNEAVLVNDLMIEFPHACIRAVLMESLPMRSQLQIISQSDVLIGMHGAGMTHVMFLPQHAGVLELFPKGFKTNRPWYECFHSITKWRGGMKYDSWENFDDNLEMPFDFTVLPTDVIVKKARNLVNQLCPV